MANPSTATATKPQETVTVVINNREGLEVAQLPHRGTDSHKRIIFGEVVTLLPGLNLVPTETLNILRKNPVFELKFKSMIPDSRAPEQRPERVGKPILELGKELPTGSNVCPLSALPVNEALALVKEANEEQLQAFKETESREEVRKLVNKRIEEFDAASKIEAE
jgi:hypothetical protein